MDSFELDLLTRLPLAEATWSLYRYVPDDEVLDGVFEAHRGRAYECSLAFSTLVGLVADALLVHDSGARQSFSAGRTRVASACLTPSPTANSAAHRPRCPKPCSRRSGIG